MTAANDNLPSTERCGLDWLWAAILMWVVLLSGAVYACSVAVRP